MKRWLSLMLCLVMVMCLLPLCACSENEGDLKGAKGAALLEQSNLPPVSPEGSPYLALYVEYQKGGEEGVTHAKATLLHVTGNEKHDNPAAEDVVIELKAEDTLELRSGSDAHVFYDGLACGDTYTFEFDLYCAAPRAYVERTPEPRLTISVTSANVGRCEYTCVFDSTTEPRALLLGWDVENKTPNAIRNDLDMMKELFGRSYYNMQPVIQYGPYFNHEDIWELLKILPMMETDENDVTYIYLNAHDSSLGFFAHRIIRGFRAFAPGTTVTVDGEEYSDTFVLYKQFLPWIARALKGRIVLVIDACYSRTAIECVDEEDFAPDRLSLMTSIDGGSTSGAYDSPITGAYGWFTKELYDRYLTETGLVPIGDAYSYMHEYAEEHVTLTMLNPQFTGNADTALFCFDANTWIDDPEFVVIEESIAVTTEEAVIVTTDIDETAYDRTESYIVRPTVTVTGRQDVSDRINARLAQLYDDTQWIIGELEQEPLPANAGKHLYTLTLKDASATGSLLYLTFEEVRYTSGAARPMSGQYVLTFDTATGQEAELKELLISGPEASEQLVGMIEAGLTEKYADNLFVDAGTAAGYALTNERVTWKMGADGLHILYPGDWISPRYLGTLDVALTQEQLSSLLAGEQTAAISNAQGHAGISRSNTGADFGLAGESILEAEGLISEAKVSIVRGDDSYSYPVTVVFYATALNGQSAFLPAFSEQEWYEVTYESGGQTVEARFE